MVICVTWTPVPAPPALARLYVVRHRSAALRSRWAGNPSAADDLQTYHTKPDWLIESLIFKISVPVLIETKVGEAGGVGDNWNT